MTPTERREELDKPAVPRPASEIAALEDRVASLNVAIATAAKELDAVVAALAAALKE
jgi:hypothetical protein